MTPPSKYYGLAFADLPIVAEREKDQAADENIGEIKKRLREFSRKIVSQMGSSADDPVSEVIITAGHVVEETLNTADAKECDLSV
jgi:nucleotide-binding universal stress UspA family protein